MADEKKLNEELTEEQIDKVSGGKRPAITPEDLGLVPCANKKNGCTYYVDPKKGEVYCPVCLEAIKKANPYCR